MREARLDYFFDAVILSRDVGFRKPHPAIFWAAMARLDATPAESVFIGDRLAEDVLGAMDVGMKAIWIVDPQVIKKQSPIESPLVSLAKVNDFSEVMELIDEIDSSGSVAPRERRVEEQFSAQFLP